MKNKEKCDKWSPTNHFIDFNDWLTGSVTSTNGDSTSSAVNFALHSRTYVAINKQIQLCVLSALGHWWFLDCAIIHGTIYKFLAIILNNYWITSKPCAIQPSASLLYHSNTFYKAFLFNFVQFIWSLIAYFFQIHIYQTITIVFSVKFQKFGMNYVI